jgi:hypothetical protein
VSVAISTDTVLGHTGRATGFASAGSWVHATSARDLPGAVGLSSVAWLLADVSATSSAPADRPPTHTPNMADTSATAMRNERTTLPRPSQSGVAAAAATDRSDRFERPHSIVIY